MLIYIGHLLSLLIYVAVILTCLIGFHNLLHTSLEGGYKKMLWMFYISLSLQSISFLGLQIDWIYMDYNTAVGDTVAYAWLAFDYFNGFALLTFATALNVYTRWRRLDNCDADNIYRRRVEDHPPP